MQITLGLLGVLFGGISMGTGSAIINTSDDVSKGIQGIIIMVAGGVIALCGAVLVIV